MEYTAEKASEKIAETAPNFKPGGEDFKGIVLELKIDAPWYLSDKAIVAERCIFASLWTWDWQK